jgi:D-sedoheptulose 7-phosphate isomerase
VELANRLQATTIALTGFDGGQLGPLAEVNLHVPSQRIEHVEDVHLILEHMITQVLRDRKLPARILDRSLPVGSQVPLGSETGALE